MNTAQPFENKLNCTSLGLAMEDARCADTGSDYLGVSERFSRSQRGAASKACSIQFETFTKICTEAASCCLRVFSDVYMYLYNLYEADDDYMATMYGITVEIISSNRLGYPPAHSERHRVIRCLQYD